MSNTIIIKCIRCNGSGRHSFNVRDGDMCYGCSGVGRVAVDADKHAKSQVNAAKRAALKNSQAARRAELASEIAAELDAQFGPFTQDMQGSFARVLACQKAYGKTPGELVNARLAK